jgi:hypothetical protein
MDQKKIRAFAGTALLAGVIAFMGTGAVQAQSVTPSEAAHHVIEQELQSHVPGQAVYAQNGVVIRSGIIREKDLLIHYPQVRVMGKPEVSRRITRYFEKQAEISRENYNKANTMEEKLTSRVDFAVSYHGERYLSFQTYGYDFVERAAHPTSWELGKTFDLETGKLVPWQKVLTPSVRGNFTLDKINRALWNTDYGKGHYFFQDFKGLEKLPENYYLDQEGHIHFVFGQYEIAPYAVGIIDLNMDQGV